MRPPHAQSSGRAVRNLGIDEQPAARRWLAVLTDGCGVPPGHCTISSADEGGRVTVRASLLTEPMTRAGWTTHDYNVHFCIGLENQGDRAIVVELLIGAEWEQLPETRPLLYAASNADGPFEPANFEARTDLKKRYAVRLGLDPGKRLYIANHCPRPLAALYDRLDELAQHGAASRKEIGRSYDGRPIVAYTYGGGGGKPVVLVISGTHPPEPDTYASEAVMEWLASPGAQRTRQSVTVVVIPVANPDGFIRRTQGANAAGINFFWDFALDQPTLCPEAKALWALAHKLRPRAYIDYHGYTFQLRKEPGPYARPALFYRSSAVRQAAARIYSRMVGRYGDVAVGGFSAYAPETLASRLASEFDTITVAKFHVHLKRGIDACKSDGVRAFRVVIEELLSGELCRPAEPVGIPVLLRQLRRARQLWAGFLRPTLGLLRRGKAAAVDFRRRAIVPAANPFGRA